MTKFRSICFALLTTTCDTSAWAAPGALEDDELTRGTTRPWRSEDVPSLFSKSETTVSTTFYSRNRHATDHAGDIHVDALSLGLDWRSGYAAGPWGFVGADLSGLPISGSRPVPVCRKCGATPLGLALPKPMEV